MLGGLPGKGLRKTRHKRYVEGILNATLKGRIRNSQGKVGNDFNEDLSNGSGQPLAPNEGTSWFLDSSATYCIGRQQISLARGRSVDHITVSTLRLVANRNFQLDFRGFASHRRQRRYIRVLRTKGSEF